MEGSKSSRISQKRRRHVMSIKVRDDNDPIKVEKKKVQRRRRDQWLSEIKKYQNSTDLLLRKLPFCRLVKEVTREISRVEFRYSESAILALQEASEAYLIGLIEDGQRCCIHDNRITLAKKDLELAERIRGDR